MTELPQLLSLGAHTSSQKPLLFVDSYFVTKAYFEQAGRSFRIAYLDDVKAHDFPLDYVINYDVLSKDTLAEYTRFYSSANTRLLGSSYAPLRPQFWHPRAFCCLGIPLFIFWSLPVVLTPIIPPEILFPACCTAFRKTALSTL